MLREKVKKQLCQNTNTKAVEELKSFYSYCVQDKDAGFALRGDEQAKQSLVPLAVMVQVHVANTP